MVGLLAQYHTNVTSPTSLDSIMSKAVERPLDSNFFARPTFRDDIEFREVSFQFPSAEEKALTKVSFKIKAGERVALLRCRRQVYAAFGFASAQKFRYYQRWPQ